MIEDNDYRKKLKDINFINIIGRDILYVEAIEEFFKEFNDVEVILIKMELFIKNEKYIYNLAEKYANKNFYILYSNTLEKNSSILENIFYYEQEEFVKLKKKIEKEEFHNMENTLELNNSLQNNREQDINLSEKQNKFLETTFGKVVNSALDIGLRAVLPDIIENEVIDIKDIILESGLKTGLKSVVDAGLNLGKSAIGIFTGEFENISQIQIAVKNGGIIDGISNLLDYSIKFAKNKGLISISTANLLKQGKNTILNSISSKIEEELTEQLKAAEKLQEYCNKWQENYEKEDFSSMESNLKNIEKYLEKITPLENTIKQARKIENIHNLIKNNGKNFNISENEKILAEKLAI